jgi:hypothetical protein
MLQLGNDARRYFRIEITVHETALAVAGVAHAEVGERGHAYGSSARTSRGCLGAVPSAPPSRSAVRRPLPVKLPPRRKGSRAATLCLLAVCSARGMPLRIKADINFRVFWRAGQDCTIVSLLLPSPRMIPERHLSDQYRAQRVEVLQSLSLP